MSRTLAGSMASVEDQLLHAWRLGFTHPHTGLRLRFATTVPAAFGGVLEALGFADPAAGLPRVEGLADESARSNEESPPPRG